MTRTCVGIVVGFLVCVIPGTVQADPVTFTYRIDMLRVCHDDHLLDCEALQQSFPLRVTFDTVPTVDHPGYKSYGPPSFSEVPLFRPAIPEGVPLQILGGTGHSYDRVGDQWEHRALAWQSIEFSGLGSSPNWEIELVEFELLSSPPVLSATSFGALLGRGQNPFGFQYQYRGFSEGVFAPPRLDYFGTATLIDSPAAVPEPASLWLVGTGLLAAGARRWRKCRHS